MLEGEKSGLGQGLRWPSGVFRTVPAGSPEAQPRVGTERGCGYLSVAGLILASRPHTHASSLVQTKHLFPGNPKSWIGRLGPHKQSTKAAGVLERVADSPSSRGTEPGQLGERASQLSLLAQVCHCHQAVTSTQSNSWDILLQTSQGGGELWLTKRSPVW